MTAIKKFEVGKTYATTFITDSDSKAYFTIRSRTDKSVTIAVSGKMVRRKVTVWQEVEQFKPFGSYSMCMIIDANDLQQAH